MRPSLTARFLSSSEYGFTLIELMIVVAIIGILAAVSIPKFADLISKSEEGSTKGSLATIRSALAVYYADNDGAFPVDNLASLTADSKYLSAIPQAYIPGHHSKAHTVQNNDDWGTAAIATVDTGGWLYWNWTSGLGVRHRGDIWIGCTHADSKNVIWTTY